MAFAHGKGADFRLDNSGGSLTNISTYLDDVSFPQTIETAETTTFGASSKSYIVGLRDATISLSGKQDATLDAHISAVLGPAATLSFQYSPEGTGSGAIKYTGECIVTGYDVSAPIGDVVSVSIDLQVSGDVTRATH